MKEEIMEAVKDIFKDILVGTMCWVSCLFILFAVKVFDANSSFIIPFIIAGIITYYINNIRRWIGG